MDDSQLRQEIQALRESLKDYQMQNAKLEHLLAQANAILEIAHQSIEAIFKNPELINEYKSLIEDHSNNLQ